MNVHSFSGTNSGEETVKRTASVDRTTRETQVQIELNLEGRGRYSAELQTGFFSHMLELLALHSSMDLRVQADGDLQVDDHHLIEDVGIVLGQALKQALGEKRGIRRYGWTLLPMDEVLVAVAVDLGGRFVFRSDYTPVREKVGDLATEMAPHFFRSLAVEAGANLHIQFLNPGENEHHRIEAMFKGFGRALRTAVSLDPAAGGRIPSTKGSL